MDKKVIEFNLSQRQQKDYPKFRTGDVVKVYRKIKEGGKERTQIFEGMIIAVKGGQSSSPMITVRKVSEGVGVEIVIPVYSPSIEKIELVKRAMVKRAKLYYVREKTVKSLRFKYKQLAELLGLSKAKKAEEKVEEVVEAKKEEVVAEEKAVEETKEVKENETK